MHSVLVSSMIFVSVFAAAILGMVVRVPESHIGSEAKEVVRLSTGLVATMAALVLGMLVSSTKASYDARKNEIAEMSYDVCRHQSLLAKYGPETAGIRAEFRQLVETGLDRIWPNQASRQAELRPSDYGESLINQIELLAPTNDRQAAAKAQALSMVIALRRTQWLLFLKAEQNAVPLPLLLALAAWLAAIFLSFGLFAAPNSTTVATLALSAIAVSSAIFIILEMYTPFSGVLRIPPTPILEAVKQMGR